MEKCLLTSKGNVIRFHPTLEVLYLQDPKGEFVCILSGTDLEESKVQESLEIDIHFPPPHSEIVL